MYEIYGCDMTKCEIVTYYSFRSMQSHTSHTMEPLPVPIYRYNYVYNYGEGTSNKTILAELSASDVLMYFNSKPKHIIVSTEEAHANALTLEEEVEVEWIVDWES